MTAVTSPPLPDLRSRLSGIRPEIEQARHLPGEIYTSPEIEALEKQRIFMTHWLCVARVEELEKPGDYMALRIAGEPIVVAHARGEGIVAYMNMCLHRGVEVASGSGNAKSFSCPYHAWTYDPGGKLIGAPLMKDSGHDLSGCRLPRIQTALWRGWVFVNFAADAPPFENFIAPYEKELWWYRTGECRVAQKLVFEVECNWKFIAENLIDWYHAGTVHIGTFGRFYKIGRERLPAKLLPDGGSVIEFDASSRTSDPNLPFPKLPWLADRDVFSGKGVMFPNINFWSGADSLRMWHLWPVATGKTRAVCYILLPEASFSAPDFAQKLEQYGRYVKAVAAEDRGALESLQRGVASPRYVPGPLAHLEVQLQHLLKHYVDVVAA